ncbi:hypothetical protein Sjap_013525 [Stephania japonica]|uniref:BED-type domain-containing protein n=1 Tax=Stephania japonica TaxID=461633 RepID=A0AAP0NYP2_9MAGN
MASELEPIPISSLKHDPAWKHCQMFKNGDRVQLKCVYCYKMFSGGGIHRIKEHLACQKGNASCCPRVPGDVRDVMLQSLEGVSVKKRKKQKIAEEIKSIVPGKDEVGGFGVETDVGAGVKVVATPNAVGRSRGSERRKRGKIDNVLLPSSSIVHDGSMISVSELTTKSVKGKDQVHMAIARFLYDVGASLDAVNSPYFQPMIDAIALRGPGVEMISYHDLRGWILKNSIEEVNGFFDRCKATWGRIGCSVLVDEWITETGRVLLNFFVHCAEGLVFLKSIDVSDTIRSSDALYELLKGVVEEVGVSNVLQVITGTAEHYVIAGKRLSATFRTLYWTPCAARSINSMLEDISKVEWISVTLDSAKSITRFIYNHGAILNMMRRYTSGRDLVQPTVSRFATDFVTLKSMVNLKDSLRTMVTTQEWMDYPFSKQAEGIEIMDIILSQSFWSSCSTIVCLTDPLLGLLRVVGYDKRPAMGYILAGLYRVKEAIKNELGEKKEYMAYWDIIDSRWDQQMQHPLHEAAFFLNPRFFYSLDGEARDKIPSGMLDCVEKLVPDTKIQDKINRELILYKNAAGDFGRKMAIRTRHTLLPAEWWSTYGGGCPSLARLAIHILSQTCSAIVGKRVSIPFEQVHKTRNSLERQRLSDLVFVQYNLRLQQIQVGKNREPGPADPISSENIDLSDEWVTERREFFGDGDSDWMALDQPLINSMLSDPNDEFDNLISAGFEYQERENGVKDFDEDGMIRL